MNTEIVLPVPELKTALSGLNRMIGKRTTLPVLSCVKVSREKNGNVSLQATDLDAHATYTLTTPQVGEAVDVIVPLEQLTKASKCSGSTEAVSLVCEDQATRLRYFIGGNAVYQAINTLPVKEWPRCPEITAESSALQPGFGEALKQALACCSQDPSRHLLNGACLDARDAKAHYIVGTNGRFLYSANSFNFPLKDAVIVPNSKFITGSALLDSESCSLAIQPMPVQKAEAEPTRKAKLVNEPPPNLICLRNGPWQFVTKDVEGQYPNWKQVIPTINAAWTLLKLSPTAIDQLLKVIPNLPGNDSADSKIRLRLGEKDLRVEGCNKDDKELTSVTISKVTITGKPKQICVNRDFLVPALKFGLDEVAILDELSAMVCSKAGKRVIIMPLRPPEQRITKPKPETEPATPSPATPPADEVGYGAEERKPEMAKPTTKTEPHTPEASAKTSLLSQVEQIKDSLKNVIRDLNTLVDAVKSAEKDQRATEREVEAARATLKKIQSVTI